jgi:membrane fusion protein (multidrug efflux system)
MVVLFSCTEETKTKQTGSPQETVVETVAVYSEMFQETVEGIGTLEALKTIEIRPEINGIVVGIHFEDSAEVRKGTLLFTLDDKKLQKELRSRQAALKAAQARLELARRSVARRRDLVAEDLVSAEDYNEAQTEVREAEAEVDRLEADIALIRERLYDTTIYAPFEGRISESLVDEGDYVEAGNTLATLYGWGLEIGFSVPERYAGRIKPGQLVELTVRSAPDRTFEGRVSYVSPAVRPSTRDFIVKATAPNVEHRLKPGLFGRATVIVEEHKDRPTIPEEALIPSREGYRVFVVENGTARQRDVNVGFRRPGEVEISEGLSIGEEVIRTGHMKVSDGDRVRTVEKE